MADSSGDGMCTTAFVTGGASGIGAEAVRQLLDNEDRKLLVRGVTVVDLDERKGNQLAAELNTKSNSTSGGAACRCLFRKVDVCDGRALSKALDDHVANFGEFPRIVLLNAGIGDPKPLLAASSNGAPSSTENQSTWRRVVDINLGAVIENIRLAIPRMIHELSPIPGERERGFIAITASAAGVIPLPGQEVYSATKAACIHLARALAYLDMKKGIRVVTLCPAYTDTNMTKQLLAQKHHIAKVDAGHMLTPEFVASGIVDMAVHGDKYPGGSAMVMTLEHGKELWRFAGERRRSASGARSKAGTGTSKVDPRLRAWAATQKLTFRTVEIASLGTDFAAVSRIVTKTIPELRPGEALVRVAYAGVNASDVNYSAGRYHGGASKAKAALPLPAGFESVGVVAALGTNGKAPGLVPGQAVAALYYGGFSEYLVIPVKFLLPVNGLPRPEHLALLTSGLTASIALERPLRDTLERKKQPTVIVTAAAGGTGQFAIQIAKLAGCRVVAVAGGERKGQLCRSLGADAVVDYKALRGKSAEGDETFYSKRLTAALKKACGPDGSDIVYESVGGAMFDACERSLGIGGRLIVIGMMSQYTSGKGDGWRPSTTSPGLQDRLLYKGASVEGFFLLHHTKSFRRHYSRLSQLLERGDLVARVDEYAETGVEAAAGAVAHLQGGGSVGKVVLRLADDIPSMTSRL